MRPVESVVAASVRRPWLVLLAAALLAALGLWVTVTRFAIDTDTAKLISPTVPWRQAEIALDRAFPQRTELVAIVIDAPSAETAEEAADDLATALRARPGLFRAVERPDGGAFLARNGFLFLPTAELRATLDQLTRQAPLLSILAGDPSLRGFADTIRATLLGLRSGDVGLDDLAPRFDAFATTIERALKGEPARLSWRAVMAGGEGSLSDLRKIVLARPVMDYTALQPGAAATDAVREAAARLDLTAARGFDVRLTGPVPLADDEFATVAENMELNIGLTLLAVVGILFWALRSPKLVLAVLVTLLVGLVLTSGLGLLLVGSFNLISVAFFVLFIGLGVDFGIQYAVRYRAERYAHDEARTALVRAGASVGFSLTLAALSLIAGFLSFLPTDFRGVSELGLIAGLGMVIAYAASFTVLPALVAVLRPGPEGRPVETASLAGLDHWIAGHRRLVLGATGLVVLAGLPALLALRFDSDPMNLRDPSVESVSTYLDLARDPATSPTSLDVLAPNAAEATRLAERLAALPEVGRVISLSTFLPEEQDRKLELLRAAEPDLAAVLAANPVPGPSPAEAEAALRRAATGLRDAAAGPTSPARASVMRLATALDRTADAAAGPREAVRRAVTVDFERLVAGLRAAFTAETVTRANLPPSITDAWQAADGRLRLEVFPKDESLSPAARDAFAAAVRAIAPGATGAPVSIVESGRTIVTAFTQAGIYAFVAITLILWVAMRRLLDVMLALGPLVLAGILTLQAARIVGLDLNFANIIALPLMFGVGVAFHIYYLIAWRAGVAEALASSLTRAIFFSALTTGVAFGSLWASSHPGTASMGELLAISLVFTLLAAFLIVPAFLGPPPAAKKPVSGASGRG